MVFFQNARAKNAITYIPTIIAVAIQSRVPRIFTTLSSLASFLPMRNATKPKNANIKTIKVIILKKAESIFLLSNKSADTTDTTGIDSIIIAVVRFVIFPLSFWISFFIRSFFRSIPSHLLDDRSHILHPLEFQAYLQTNRKSDL